MAYNTTIRVNLIGILDFNSFMQEISLLFKSATSMLRRWQPWIKTKTCWQISAIYAECRWWSTSRRHE